MVYLSTNKLLVMEKLENNKKETGEQNKGKNVNNIKKEKNIEITNSNNKKLGESNFGELGFIDKNKNFIQVKKEKEIDDKAKKYILDYINKIVG